MDHIEPMDIDCIDSDFENKENSLLHSNVLPRTPCTEKGYEELDVSELNMKLRYSVTPGSSPMSRSFTANCRDNNTNEILHDNKNDTIVIGSTSLTNTFNSTLTSNDGNKPSKLAPLQMLPTNQLSESGRNILSQRSLDIDNNNITITLNDNVDENLSIASTSSSVIHTPEAITPTKELQKDGGSPIMRGLRSVLNIFRSSQSPIPSNDHVAQNLSPIESHLKNVEDTQLPPVQVSTPLHKTNRSSKRNSPNKDSLVFMDDLEKELQWKDETTILFKEDKIPIHKLYLQQSVASNLESKLQNKEILERTLEYMDISYNDSALCDKTITDSEMKQYLVETKTKQTFNIESTIDSDGEFLDCENIDPKVDTISDNELRDNVDVRKEKNETIVSTVENENNYSSNSTAPIDGLHSSCNLVEDDKNVAVLEEVVTYDTIHSVEHNESNTLALFQDRSLLEIELSNNLNINHDSETLKTIPYQSIDLNEIKHDIDCVNNKSQNNVNNVVIPIENNFGTSEGAIIKDVVTSDNIENYLSNVLDDKVKDDNVLTCGSLSQLESLSKVVTSERNCMMLNNVSNSIFENINCPNENKNVFTSEHINKVEREDEIFCKTDNEGDDSAYTENPESISDKTIEFNEKNCAKEISSPKEVVPSIKDELNISNNMNLNDNMTKLLNNAEIVDVTSNVNSKITENSSSDLAKAIDIDKDVPIDGVLQDLVKPLESLQQNNEKLSEESKQSNSHSGYIEHMNNINNSLPKMVVDAVLQTESNEVETLNKSFANNDKHTEVNIEYIETRNSSQHDITKIEIHLNECDSILNLPTEIPLPNDYESEQDVNTEEPKNNVILMTENKNDLYDIIVEKECSSNIDESEKNISLETTSNKATYDTEDKIDSKDVTIDNLVTNEYISSVQNEKVYKVELNHSSNTNTKKSDNLPNNNIIDTVYEKTIEIVTPNSLQLNRDANGQDKVVDICEQISVDEMQTNTNMTKCKSSLEVQPVIEENLEVNKLEDSLIIESNRPLDLNSDANVDANSKKSLDEVQLTYNLEKSPPLSPLASKRGYDINFDEIDDPFATKTKIRLSPTAEISTITFNEIENPFVTKTKIRLSPTVEISPKNHLTEKYSVKDVPKLKKDYQRDRRKSQPARKVVNPKKKSLNSTLDYCARKKETDKLNMHDKVTVATPELLTDKIENLKPITVENANSKEDRKESVTITTENELDRQEKHKPIELFCKNESDIAKNVESSSVFSNSVMKNVFNYPEIKDELFCFPIDKATMQMPNQLEPSINSHNVVLSQLDQCNCPEKQELSPHVNTTCTSQSTEKDTIGDMNTEDEDTVEGPFIEMDEVNENDDPQNIASANVIVDLEASPSAVGTDNVDNGELFIDAEAFEFLLNQNKSNDIADSGKESLFLKFDPLFAKRVSSDGVIAALKKVQEKMSTPKKLTKLPMQETVGVPEPSSSKNESTFNDQYENEEGVQSLSKPMMVVTPAVNSIVSPRKVTPKINRQSLTFTSPAMAVIDRLLSLSGNASIIDQNTQVSSPGGHNNDTNIAITQLREMLAEKDIHVHNLRRESKELKERLANLETQVRTLETESEGRLKKVNELNERLAEKVKMNKSMAVVVEEYERTIASLISEMEQEKRNNAEERRMLIKERDEQTAHLTSMEVSFSDLHSKYEKSKQIIMSMKTNEDTYRKSIKEFEENLLKMQNNYELLKQHATSKLNHANQELEKFNKAHEADILKLNAMIKRKELHITSLEETLAQKSKANEELTAICDELINKVG